MKIAGLFLSLPLLLAACGKAPEAGGAEHSATEARAGSDCTGATLPVTGLCSDAEPALFIAIDEGLDTVARGCVWRTEELQTGEDKALVFRAQDCSGEMWDKVAYTWVGHYVKSRPVTVPEDQAAFLLEVLDVGKGQTAEDVARRTLSSAPENQRLRCDIVSFTGGPKVAGRTFRLTPNAELQAELDARPPDEPWEACGPNGVAAGIVQFWEGRENRALFHIISHNEPLWDPASFTFYARNADGAWSITE